MVYSKAIKYKVSLHKVFFHYLQYFSHCLWCLCNYCHPAQVLITHQSKPFYINTGSTGYIYLEYFMYLVIHICDKRYILTYTHIHTHTHTHTHKCPANVIRFAEECISKSKHVPCVPLHKNTLHRIM